MFRAELLALVTTTATKVATATAVVGLVLTQLTFVTLLPALANGDIGPGADALGDELPRTDLSPDAVQMDALSPLGASMGGGSLGITMLALALLGVLAGTSDYRFGGIVGAALAAPRRGRIMAAKAAAAAVAGLVVGVSLAVASAVTLLLALAVAEIPFAVGPLTLLGLLTRGALAVGCLVLIGLAVGVLSRNQLAGVLVMLALLVGEPMVSAIAQLVTGTTPAWTQALPVALTHAAIGAGPSLWGSGVALALLLALTGVALAAATVALQRRDI